MLKIIGHQKQWDFLSKTAERKKLSHAYLFSGQDKLGKKTLALEWLSLIFGSAICADGKIIHPDFFLIEPEEKEIKIKQIRDLIWKLSLKPYSAPFKAAIINEAHSMNEEAQNSLLKTLEEPRGNTILILITQYPQYLLPTILSRIERIKFYPVEKEKIKNYLKSQGLTESKANEIVKISFGKSGQAIDFFSDPEKIKDWEDVKNKLIMVCKSDLVERFQYAKELSQKENLKEILEVWLAVFRENLLLMINSGLEKKQHNDNGSMPGVLSYSLAKVKNILSRIQTINYLIATTNVNTRLILETFMLDL